MNVNFGEIDVHEEGEMLEDHRFVSQMYNN